jgi:putative two-component system response regulator
MAKALSSSVAPVQEPARLLVVDDEEYISDVICRWLEAAGYQCVVASDGISALKRAQMERFDVVVSDINMPGMSGLDLMSELRRRQPDIPVILATAVDDRDVAIDALKKGAYGYLIKPLQEDEIIINVANALERRRLERLDRAYQEGLEQEVAARTEEVSRTREEISLLLVTASEFRDLETGAHVRRMGLYAEALASALGWGRDFAEQLRLAAPMHDIGKIGVPDRILLKPGRLTAAEFEAVKKHANIGAEILSQSDLPLLKLARDIARAHHEKWDGSGYPGGLKGEAIPEAARLVAVTDVYDALTHDRVYRAAMSEEEALESMWTGRGVHFDPKMFDAFIAQLPAIRQIRANAA